MSGSLSTSALASLIAQCEDRETVFDVLTNFIADCGAKCAVLYNFQGGVKSAAEQWTPIYSSFPAEISAYYQTMRCITGDPFIRTALSSDTPARFLEAEDGFEPSEATRGLYAMMRAYGLRDGLSMHISDGPGRPTYFCLAYDYSLEDMTIFERRRIQACMEMFMRHAGTIIEPENRRALSPKEQEVVACLARGESNKQIARTLGLSPNTVNTLVSRSFEKLGANTRTEAVIAACRTGLPLVA